MTFSIIIINYKTPDITINCLNSIFEFCDKKDFEIILIDNNSKDNSIDFFKKNFSEKITLIENDKNIGFSKANNQGAKIATGEYLFFLNSDTILEKNILEKIKNIFKDTKIGILSPQLINQKHEESTKDYGKYPKIYSSVINKLKKTNNFKIVNQKIIVDWVSGAAMVIPKKIFNKIGAWDDKFFMYFEDIDLCKRVKELGYSIIVAKNIKLIHLSGKSLNKNNLRRQYYYNSQNYYFKKHHGLLSLLLLKIIRWPYKLITLSKK